MIEINHARTLFITATGTIGGIIASFFGGWDNDIITLVIFMVIDYIMGVIIAAFLGKSAKSDNGALSSKAGWIGLCRKCATLLFVIIAHRLDILIGTEYIRNAVVIGFCASELISIVENAGIMGLPMPPAIIKAIDILKGKGDKNDD